MLMRINYENFLIYAIDHFDKYQIDSFGYVIISAKVRNGSQDLNICKPNSLYPTVEMQTRWREMDYDFSFIKDMYKEEILKDEDVRSEIFRHIVEPVYRRVNVLIICADHEDELVDTILEFIYDEYKITAADLNQLFESGEINSLEVDINEVHDNIVTIRRKVTRMMWASLSTTQEGRRELLSRMTKSEKLDKLEELDCDIADRDLKSLDALLISLWVEAEDDVDE